MCHVQFSSFLPYSPLYYLILQIEKLRLIKIEGLDQSYTAGTWQS